MESIDELNFSTRKEYRLYDRINFRLKQEILLRDDEIHRLKKRLEAIKMAKKSNFNKGVLTSNGYSDQLSFLQNQIYVENNKAEMKLTNASIMHSQKIEQMKQQYEKEIKELKQILYNQMASNNNSSYLTEYEDSEQIEQFLSSLENIVHSKKRKKRIDPVPNYNKYNKYNDFEDIEDLRANRVKDDDIIFTNSRFFDMHLYNEEFRDNQQRIKQLRQLIFKYQGYPEYSTSNNYSDAISKNDSIFDYSMNPNQNETNNSASIVHDNSKLLQVKAKIQQLTNKHKKEVEILTKKIKKEKKNEQFKKRKIEIAANNSFLTDAEIAAMLKTQDKIKKKKERANSLMITIESLSEMDIKQREDVLRRLRLENITLKREISRVDAVAYGRTGKYQYWKKLSDEELLKCTMLYYT